MDRRGAELEDANEIGYARGVCDAKRVLIEILETDLSRNWVSIDLETTDEPTYLVSKFLERFNLDK